MSESTYIKPLLGFDSWPSSTVNLVDLKDNAVPYLVQLGVINKANQGSYDFLERQLILNRLARYIDVEQPYLKLCMYYFSFLSFCQEAMRFDLFLLLITCLFDFPRPSPSVHIWCRLERQHWLCTFGSQGFFRYSQEKEQD